MTSIDHIKVIAERTRTWVQQRAEQSRYNPDTLLGWCAIASCELHRQLLHAGINNTLHLHLGNECDHVYVLAEDYVIDITATQFDMHRPDVLLLHHKEAEAVSPIYQSSVMFDSADTLREYQLEAKWPSQQIAYSRTRK